MTNMIELFQYPFIQRALIVGLILAALLAYLGIFVILKRMAFFGDGVAHASLAGIAIGLLAGISPLVVALLYGIAIALVMYWTEQKGKITSDAVIGIFFTASMALGVVLMNYQPGYQPELISFLFGNILTIKITDVYIIGLLAAIVLIFLSWHFKKISHLTFDRESAFLAGINVTLLEITLYIALAIAVVIGVKILGIVLVSALLILPASTSKLIARSFRGLLINSIIIGELSVLVGIFLSYRINWPTGATIVLVGTALFITTLLLRSILPAKNK